MDLTSRSGKAKTSSEDSQTYLKYQLSDDSFVTVSMPYESIDVESEQVSLRVVTDPAPPVVAHRITSQEDDIGSVLLLVVATSRSMVDIQEDLVEESGGSFATRGEVVLDAIDSLIDECRDEDVLGLVTFAYQSKVVFPLENANKDKKKEWKENLRKIKFAGMTNLEKGITEAVSQLKDLDKERYASASIMIICDGFINAGKGFVNSMNDDKIKAAQKELADFTKESLQEIEGLKVRVSVCGIGDDFDRGMLREMCNTGAARGLPYSLAQPSTLLEKMKTALSKTLELERTRPAGRRKKKTLVANEMKIRIELNQGASLSKGNLGKLLRKGNKKNSHKGMKKIALDSVAVGDQNITFSPLPEKAMIDISVLLGPADGLGKHDDTGQTIMPLLSNTKNMYRIATIYALWLKDNEVIEEEVKGHIDVVREGDESILDEQIQRLNEIQDTMGGLIGTLRKVSGMDEMEAVQEETIVETESELDSTQVDTVQKLEEILALHKSFTKKLDNGNFTQKEVDEVLQSKEMLSYLIDMFVAGRKAIDYVLKLKKDLEKADADEYALGCDFAGFFDLLCSSLETGLGNTGLDTDGTGGSDQKDTNDTDSKGGSDQKDMNELLMKAKEALDAVMAGLENAIEDGIVEKLRRQIEDQEDEQKRGHPASKRSSGIRDSLKRLSRSFKKGGSQL